MPPLNNHQFQLPQLELGSTPDQQLTATDPTAWLWSQIGFGNLDTCRSTSAAAALSGDGKLYQLPSNGTSTTNLTGVTVQPEFCMYDVSDALEPGEIRVAAAEASIINGLTDGHGTSELMLLREALSAKGKEAARLTRELERAYGLIQRLQQQNIMYQQLDWNYQQQQQHQELQSNTDTNLDVLVNGASS